ncbi:hypothetical protein BLNAU_4622 [Blattamonas nauphoetae]|uniref:Uncharacterized protein n=1 Tax=Blattamonas nauphoetae TaxID=2049346 RepID=A0ABQ9Y9J7_9EUKA|nr:hypothetical protein BLNAU_4622 [Blattamonas nauphoetae]
MDPSKRAQSVATLSSTKHLKKKNTANELSRSASTLVVSTTTEIKPKKTKKSKLTITDSTDSLLIDRSELQTPEPSGKKKTKTKKTTNSNDNTSPNAGDTTHHDTPNAGGKSADGHTKSPLSQSSSSVTKKLLKNQKHARSTSSLTTINSLDSDASEDEDREDQFRTLTTGGNTSSLARLIKHSRNRSTASLSDSTTFQTGGVISFIRVSVLTFHLSFRLLK